MHLSSGHYNTYTIVQSESDPTPNSPIPTSAWFSEGNGGEMRKSYHGYPKGYAQLIDSPVSFSVQPMQVCVQMCVCVVSLSCSSARPFSLL